jgi:hypothetical protein
MRAYQTRANVGTLSWSLSDQPAGAGIVPSTGVITAVAGAYAEGHVGTLKVIGPSGAATSPVNFYLRPSSTGQPAPPIPGPSVVQTARMLSPFNIGMGGNINKYFDYNALFAIYALDKWFYLSYNGSVFRLRFNNAENSQIRNTDFQHSAASGWVTATGVAATVTPTIYSSQLPTTTTPWSVAPWAMTEMRNMPGLGATAATVAASYSLRPLNHSDANRKVLAVRRSSDSVTADIYADPFGTKLSLINGVKYESWLTGATGYVVTWYDQSGNGRHMTQPTTSMQPVLVMEPTSGEYAVFFSGGDATTKTGLTFSAGISASGMSVVFNAIGNSSGWQTLVGTNHDNAGLRTAGNKFLGRTGDGNDFPRVTGAKGYLNGIEYTNATDWPYDNCAWNHVVATTPSAYNLSFYNLGLPGWTNLYNRAFCGYMHEVVLFSNTPSVADAADMRLYRPVRQVPTVPVRAGMVGYYSGESWDISSNKWYDMSGVGNHVTNTTGVISAGHYPSTGLRYVYGGTTSKLTFPASILPPTYTFFHRWPASQCRRSMRYGSSQRTGFRFGLRRLRVTHQTDDRLLDPAAG